MSSVASPAVHRAFRTRDATVLARLLDEGLDVNTRLRSRLSLLGQAVSDGWPEGACTLMKHGASPWTSDDLHPLVLAAEHPDPFFWKLIRTGEPEAPTDETQRRRQRQLLIGLLRGALRDPDRLPDWEALWHRTAPNDRPRTMRADGTSRQGFWPWPVLLAQARVPDDALALVERLVPWPRLPLPEVLHALSQGLASARRMPPVAARVLTGLAPAGVARDEVAGTEARSGDDDAPTARSLLERVVDRETGRPAVVRALIDHARADEQGRRALVLRAGSVGRLAAAHADAATLKRLAQDPEARDALRTHADALARLAFQGGDEPGRRLTVLTLALAWGADPTTVDAQGRHVGHLAARAMGTRGALGARTMARVVEALEGHPQVWQTRDRKGLTAAEAFGRLAHPEHAQALAALIEERALQRVTAPSTQRPSPRRL